MIAKEIAMPRTGGSFRGLVSYLTSARGKAERVGDIRLGNCVSADVASAVLEVENAQARNSRARHTTYHVMLSFHEQPPSDVLEAIERKTCAELGFADHHRASVVHHDTDHVHVHIAINRVHPKTHRVHWPSYSKLALDRLCVELEQQYGLVPDRHLAREREARLQATTIPNRRPPDMEAVSGFESLIGFVQRKCGDGLRAARSWAELHQVAQSRGLHVQLRGNGLVFVAGEGAAVKGSSIARDLSKAALERRLGPFQENVTPPPAVRERYQKQPIQIGSAALYERYIRHREMEAASGFESLIGFVQRKCGDGLRAARSWVELHEVAQSHGLQARLRGSGLVFVAGEGTAVKGSSIARDLSKAALGRRLGPYEASTTASSAVVRYQRQPIQLGSAALYERYTRHREEANDRRRRAIVRLRDEREAEGARWQQGSQRRWAAVRLVAKGRIAWMLWSAYAREADRRERERARQRRRWAARAAVADLRRPSWIDWLRVHAARGDAEALATLRMQDRRRGLAPNALHGDGKAESRALQAPVDGVTRAGTVIYRIAGCTIRDDGARLYWAGSNVSASAAETLVRAAYARYGQRLGVDGDETFRSRLVGAAVTAGLPIQFADEELERRRIELQQREKASRDRGLQQARTTAPRRPRRARSMR